MLEVGVLDWNQHVHFREGWKIYWLYLIEVPPSPPGPMRVVIVALEPAFSLECVATKVSLLSAAMRRGRVIQAISLLTGRPCNS